MGLTFLGPEASNGPILLAASKAIWLGNIGGVLLFEVKNQNARGKNRHCEV